MFLILLFMQRNPVHCSKFTRTEGVLDFPIVSTCMMEEQVEATLHASALQLKTLLTSKVFSWHSKGLLVSQHYFKDNG